MRAVGGGIGAAIQEADLNEDIKAAFEKAAEEYDVRACRPNAPASTSPRRISRKPSTTISSMSL
jgi:hypothetical protein